MKVDDAYKLTTKELCAIAKFAQQDLFGAVALAFAYEQAKGYRAVANKTLRRNRSSSKSRATAPTERVNG